MKLLKPDATQDGKIIFNFEKNGDVVTIVKEVTDYKKVTLKAAKDAAIIEAKTTMKAKEEAKSKRDTALTALLAAGIMEENITE